MSELEDLISTNMNVKFKCRPAGNSGGEFVVQTTSTLESPADSQVLEKINNRLGVYAPEFVEFYGQHNGARFHQEPESGASSLAIHPIDAWDELTAEMSEWYDMIDEEEIEDAEIDWLNDCVSFAEVPESGNYFVLALSGVHKGNILYSDHDGLEAEIYAGSFKEFLIKFLSSPVEQIDHLGCYTRYSDGKTDLQWMPVESV